MVGQEDKDLTFSEPNMSQALTEFPPPDELVSLIILCCQILAYAKQVRVL